MFVFEGQQLQNSFILNTILPPNQTELNLLLLFNNELPNKNNNEENQFIQKEIFGFAPLPLEFVESSQAPIIKISFEDQHRRVQFDGAAYSKLVELCTYFFGVRNPHRMVICYQDEDSDMIQISSDAELLYALTYHTKPTPNRLNILKLFFSVKKKKNEGASPIEEKALELRQQIIQQQQQPMENETQRKLKSGSLVVLKTNNFGGLFLSLSGNRAVGCAEQSLNAQWLVKTVPKEKETESQVILLSNPVFTTNNKPSHLKVSSGRVEHTGAVGHWARFCVKYLPNGQIQLRSVGRCHQHPDHSFLGIVKKQNEFVVVGDLPEGAPESLFNVHFVSK